MQAIELTESAQTWTGEGVVVAVIDTGIDVNHPLLKESLWINPGETGIDSQGRDKSTNHVDDDGNGFVDDLHGWNFVSNSPQIQDLHGHGTHVSGIIAAKSSVSGVRGVAPGAKLMVIKYFDDSLSGLETMQNTVKAIEYAISMGAQVINYSSGGRVPYLAEKAAIKKAEEKGILFVAAAGNESSNSDKSSYFPADYGTHNLISVTAIGRTRHVLPSSNFGERSVDLAAPGEDILSTMPGGKVGKMTGTSQATAFVTGVVCQMLERFGRSDVNWIKERMLESARYSDELYKLTKTRGVVSSSRSLTGSQLRFMALQGLQPQLPEFVRTTLQ